MQGVKLIPGKGECYDCFQLSHGKVLTNAISEKKDHNQIRKTAINTQPNAIFFHPHG